MAKLKLRLRRSSRGFENSVEYRGFTARITKTGTYLGFQDTQGEVEVGDRGKSLKRFKNWPQALNYVKNGTF